jgi:hypothetical protein
VCLTRQVVMHYTSKSRLRCRFLDIAVNHDVTGIKIDERQVWELESCRTWNIDEGFLIWRFLLAHFPKVVLCDLNAVRVSVNPPPPLTFWMLEPVFVKLGMYIMAPEPISTVYFINPSHQSVSPYVYPSFLARQRLYETLPRHLTHTRQWKNCSTPRFLCSQWYMRWK